MLVLIDNLERSQAFAVSPVTISKARECTQHIEVTLDLLKYAWPQDLGDNFGARFELRRMNLCDGGGRERFGIKALKNGLYRFAIGGIDDFDCLFGRKRRHRILQLGKLISDIRWQQVTPGRDCLAKFDEDRAEFFQRETNSFSEWRRTVASSRCEIEEEAQRPEQVRLFDNVIQPVFHEHTLDRDHAEDCSPAGHISCRPAAD
jgi:hypothetical protein